MDEKDHTKGKTMNKQIQHVRSNLYIVMIIAALFEFWTHPAWGWMLIAYILRVVAISFFMCLFSWMSATFEIRRREPQRDDDEYRT